MENLSVYNKIPTESIEKNLKEVGYLLKNDRECLTMLKKHLSCKPDLIKKVQNRLDKRLHLCKFLISILEYRGIKNNI